MLDVLNSSEALQLQWHVLQIPVAVDWKFWLVALLFGLFDSSAAAFEGFSRFIALVLWIACLLLSVLLHELGHALVGLRFNAQPSITISWLGGNTQMGEDFELNTSPRDRVTVHASGPVAGLLLGIATLLPYSLFSASDAEASLVVYLLQTIVYVNVFWGILNLLPILPLDGGLVLAEMLGEERWKVAFLLSCVSALIVSVVFASYGQWCLALYFALAPNCFYYQSRQAAAGGVKHQQLSTEEEDEFGHMEAGDGSWNINASRSTSVASAAHSKPAAIDATSTSSGTVGGFQSPDEPIPSSAVPSAAGGGGGAARKANSSSTGASPARVRGSSGSSSSSSSGSVHMAKPKKNRPAGRKKDEVFGDQEMVSPNKAPSQAAAVSTSSQPPAVAAPVADDLLAVEDDVLITSAAPLTEESYGVRY